MKPLTDRQMQALDYLKEYQSEHGFPPTLREIAAHMRISGTHAATRHVDALEKKGYLTRLSKGSRGITLLSPAGGELQPAVFLPVVGVVRAGLPQPPVEDIEEYRSVDRSLARAGAAYFLRVKGDSMINAGVLEGDLAIIRPQATADNRDMVVALVDGEATLKWFHHEGRFVRLQPANPNFEPIIVTPDRDITIIGKVVGLFRPLA